MNFIRTRIDQDNVDRIQLNFNRFYRWLFRSNGTDEQRQQRRRLRHQQKATIRTYDSNGQHQRHKRLRKRIKPTTNPGGVRLEREYPIRRKFPNHIRTAINVANTFRLGNNRVSTIGDNGGDHHQSPNSVNSNQTNSRSIESIVWCTDHHHQRHQQQQLDPTIVHTDTFSIMCDINLHSWIIWLINRFVIFIPKFYLPSTEHFIFGSVHDVSAIVQQCSNNEEDDIDRVNNRSWSTWLYDRWRLSIVPYCRTTPLTTLRNANGGDGGHQQQQLDQRVPPTQPTPSILETISKQCSIKSSRSAVVPFTNVSSNIKETDNVELSRQFLSVPTSVLMQSNETNDQQNVNDDIDEDVESLNGSIHLNDDQRWFTPHSILMITFLMILMGRYITQTGLLLFYKEYLFIYYLLFTIAIVLFTHSRSIHLQWCPLIISTLEIFVITLTIIHLIARKNTIEDQLISSASFLKPFDRNKRFMVRWLPTIYLFIWICFIIYDRIGSIVTIVQFQSRNVRNRTMILSNWHRYETYWLPSGSILPETTMETLDNDDQDKRRRIDNEEPSSLLMISIWIYSIDLILRTYMFIVYIMMKTFFFSLTLTIIFKCVQLFEEIQHRTSSIDPRLNQTNRSMANNRQVSNQYRRTSKPLTILNINQETERLSILTQMLLDIIRQYEYNFVLAVISWLITSSTVIVGLIEYWICATRSSRIRTMIDDGPFDNMIYSLFTNGQSSNISTSTTTPITTTTTTFDKNYLLFSRINIYKIFVGLYEPMFHIVHITINLYDWILLLTIVAIVRIYRHRLLNR
ncbi:hypothetical protein RDWZM_010310 [Blomia tropicalis]|uniref:Uncharacterized protein n=1 Tax=Blomia tropicalis TaxID=40697 RepID=A0A9Q0M1G1_BLOTA|nr:hypothetical protein RDWZM_010310 [Blomia tropicalis]